MTRNIYINRLSDYQKALATITRSQEFQSCREEGRSFMSPEIIHLFLRCLRGREEVFIFHDQFYSKKISEGFAPESEFMIERSKEI